jgi:hypothetical protein
MTKWIIQSSPTKYDAEGAFNEFGSIDWKQVIKADIGDIVFIYVAAPIKAIRFKCRVIKVNMDEIETDDSKYIIDGTAFENYGRYMRLELIDRFNNQQLSYDEMTKHGLKSVQGPIKLVGDLDGYVESVISGDRAYLELKDIIDNVVIIKINKSYREDMTPTELYDVTRGCWKRKIESVIKAEYALSVSYSIVREVYKIENWKPSNEVVRETIANNPETEAERLTFTGEIASDEIRARYIDKNVKNLFKWGEADPLKVILGKKTVRLIRVADNKEYGAIYEAINDCFGTNYDGWMKGTWRPSDDCNFWVWFPKLAILKDGEYKAAANDCVNVFSSDGKRLVYDDLKETDKTDPPSSDKYVVIFAKDPDGPYMFKGLFKRDNVGSRANHTEFYRVSDEVRVIGDPVTAVEPGKEEPVILPINVPMKPIEIIHEPEGEKVLCPSCKGTFKRAKRCPDCGQLIDYSEE